MGRVTRLAERLRRQNPGASGKFAETVAGKPVKGELGPASRLATVLDPATVLRKLLKTGKPFKQVLHEYHPAVDPAALLAVTYSHEQGQEPRSIEMSLGDMKAAINVDASGMPEAGSIPLGDKKMLISRQYVEGSL